MTALRSRGLKGRVPVPPNSASLALALMLGAVARGETVIYADAEAGGPEFEATLALLRATGVRVAFADDRWHVEGLGPLGLLEPAAPLDFSGAPQALTLALGLLAPYDFATRFEANPVLPIAAQLKLDLRALGAGIEEARTGWLPLTLTGPRSGMPMVWPAATRPALHRTALLLAALGLPGRSTLPTPEPMPAQAERLLTHFGAVMATGEGPDGGTLTIGGLAPLGARTLAPGGDTALALLLIVAGLVVPESELLIDNVRLTPELTGALELLREMGGEIEVVAAWAAAGEDMADLRVTHSALLGIEPGADALTTTTVPALAIAAAHGVGDSIFPRHGPDAAGLHQALAKLLAANGVPARADRHGLRLARPPAGSKTGGGTVAGDVPAELAAALMVFALGAGTPLTFTHDAAIEGRFPGLIRALTDAGGQIYRRWLA